MFELITGGLKLKKQFHDFSKENPQVIRCYSARRNAYLLTCPAESAIPAVRDYQNQIQKMLII